MLVAGGLLLLAIFLASETGSRALLMTAVRVSGGALQIGTVEGTLWRHLALNQVVIKTSSADIRLDRAEMDWTASALWRRQVRVDRLLLQRLSIRSRPNKQATRLPADLALPLALALKAGRVTELSVDGTLIAESLDFSLQSDGRQHELRLSQLLGPGFSAQGRLQLNGRRPFDLQGDLAINGQHGADNWSLSTTLGGRLDALTLNGTGRGGVLFADYRALLNPFAENLPQLLKTAQLSAKGVNLRAWSAHWPETALTVQLDALPVADKLVGKPQTVHAALQVRNALAGPWTSGKLPLSQLAGRVQFLGETVRMEEMVALLGQGRLELQGEASRNRLDLALSLDHLDPALFGGPKLPVSGRLKILGTPAAPSVQGALNARFRDKTPFSLDVDGALVGSGAQDEIRARRLLLKAGSGVLDLAGQLGLAGQQAFQLKGRADHFDPAWLGMVIGRNWPAGRINAAVEMGGALSGPERGLAATVNIAPSQFNRQALAGKIAGQWRGGGVRQVQVDLTLGSNHLAAHGALGLAGDVLETDFRLPHLAELGPDFSGALSGQLRLAGTWQRPSIRGHALGRQLKLPGALALDELQLAVSVDADTGHPAQSPVQLTLLSQGLRLGDLQVSTLSLAASGNLAAHHLTLAAQGTAAGEAFNLTALADGGLIGSDMAGWQGQLAQLENTGRWPLHLLAPTRLKAQGGGVRIEDFDALVLNGRWRVPLADWHPGRLALSGQASDIAVADWVSRLPGVAAKIPSWAKLDNLVLTSRFDLTLDQQLAGSVEIDRQSGDLVLRPDDPLLKTMPLKLTTARTSLLLDGKRADWTVEVRTEGFGSLQGQLSTLLTKGGSAWHIDRNAPLSGTLHGEMPSIAWVGPLLGPSASVAGQLQASVQAGGTLATPRWFGKIVADALVLRMPDQGVNWQDGKLLATLDGDNMRIEEITLKAGRGRVSGSGRLALNADAPEGRVSLNFDHFPLQSRPDRALVVSGDSDLGMSAGILTLNGKLRADEGQIELGRAGTPTLGDDVRVKGRPRPDKPPGRHAPLNLRVDVDLGERFRFKGEGVDTRLGGVVRLRASQTEVLSVTGALRASEGKYTAYGQELSIERGIVTFFGPVDNPALDVLAVRPNLSGEVIMVGIQVSGTVLNPKVALVSDPSMPDNEKLAWLVLGHGTAATGRDDADVLLLAAGSLFSAGGVAGIRQQLATRLGLDDISLRRSATYSATDNSPLANRVVSLGKRLSESTYIRYEQGLDGMGAAFKLSYTLSKRFSLALSAGVPSAIDWVYTLRFD